MLSVMNESYIKSESETGWVCSGSGRVNDRTKRGHKCLRASERTRQFGD